MKKLLLFLLILISVCESLQAQSNEISPSTQRRWDFSKDMDSVGYLPENIGLMALDAVTGVPLSEVRCVCISSQGDTLFVDTSDSNGNLYKGMNTVIDSWGKLTTSNLFFSKDGYEPLSVFQSNHVFDPFVVVRLMPTSSVSNKDYCTVSGTAISMDQDEHIPDIWVGEAVSLWKDCRIVAKSSVDTNGHYTLYNIPKGSYTAKIEHPGGSTRYYFPLEVDGDIEVDTISRGYFSGIDWFISEYCLILSAQVLDDKTDAPIAGVTVSLFEAVSPSKKSLRESRPDRQSTTNADGYFAFYNVLPQNDATKKRYVETGLTIALKLIAKGYEDNYYVLPADNFGNIRREINRLTEIRMNPKKR